MDSIIDKYEKQLDVLDNQIMELDKVKNPKCKYIKQELILTLHAEMVLINKKIGLIEELINFKN